MPISPVNICNNHINVNNSNSNPVIHPPVIPPVNANNPKKKEQPKPNLNMLLLEELKKKCKRLED